MIAGFKAQIADNEVQLEQVRQFKSTLYENFVSGLTAGLADTLIDWVFIYPGNQVEIVWTMKDFCME